MSDSESHFSLLSSFAKPPRLLYHYTSMEGLLGIGGSGKIYASDSRYLNDSTDSAYLYDFLEDYIAQRISEGTGHDQEYYKKLSSALKTVRMSEVFVTSFSEDEDSLSQWRAYSPGGLGFSIGFDAASLITAHVPDPKTGRSNSVTSSLRKITYLKDGASLQEELLNDGKSLGVALASLTFPTDSIDPIGATAALLAVTAPTFKHDAFRDEQEWRLILLNASGQMSAKERERRLFYGEGLGPMPGKQFRAGKSMLVPYVEAEPNTTEGYSIKEVIVGPTPHPELSIKSVEAFFQSLNHAEVTVRPSKVPYRHW